MDMTYRELRDFINTLTEEQLDLEVALYSGDIDEALPVYGTGFHTEEQMGELLPNMAVGHPLLMY